MGFGSFLGSLPGVGPLFGGPTAEDFTQQGLAASRRTQGLVSEALAPEAIIESAREFQPFFREQNLLQGSALQNQVATLLARRGATTTGFGLDSLTAALALPGINSLQDALQLATQLAQSEAAGIAGVPLTAFAQGPPGIGELGPLLGGTGGFLSAIFNRGGGGG